MRTHYSFHAALTEYRRRFRVWGVTKRMVKEDKDAIASALARRKRPGASISHVTIQQDGQSKPLDYKKLKRHLTSRKAPSLETIAPGLLSSWNLPYAAFVSSIPRNSVELFLSGLLDLTPDYLHIQSPEALTPGRAAAGPSPRMQFVYEKQKENYTSLFLQGRITQLMVTMCLEDHRTMVNYFHDFYMHGLTLAKNWGQELSIPNPAQASALMSPIRDTASSCSLSEFVNFYPEPSLPEGWNETNLSCPPTQLCKWSVHIPRGSWRYIHDGNVQPTAAADSVQPAAPAHSDPPPSSFLESLYQSFASNDFTSTPKADLPLAQDMMAKSLEADPSPLQLDAWKLAIMAGNTKLLDQLYRDNGFDPPKGIEAIHPFHLAAAFLDGGHECCGMFIMLSRRLGSAFTFFHNTDDLGHTILDALVVSILRSHTSIHPDAVSYGFYSPNRFPGEEKDICGRWDANTSDVLELFKQGYARIPTGWKHPFCHTAVQAVCHSIIAIFASPASPNINAQSGLFVRRCTECGLELKLGPLHTLVVTTFYLAQLGMPGETLFGALAVLVCLLALGGDVSTKANISVAAILRSPDDGQCHHTPLSPLELMQAVPGRTIEDWSEDCQIGWSCFVQVLALAQTEQRLEPSSRSQGRRTSPLREEGIEAPTPSSSESWDDDLCDAEFERDIHNVWLKLPCNGSRIGLLWASIQAELLIYRRLGEGEAWTSEYFSMEALKSWLEGSSPGFSTPLVQNRMLKMHTRCGWFDAAGDFLCPTAEEVCAGCFMGMDMDDRVSYIDQPDLLLSFETVEYVEDGTD